MVLEGNAEPAKRETDFVAVARRKKIVELHHRPNLWQRRGGSAREALSSSRRAEEGLERRSGDPSLEPFDPLLGRRTYDIFAAYWPYIDGGPNNDIAKTFNRITKYVATRKGVDLIWKGSLALRDAARDVAKLKQEDGPALVTQGSTELVHA